MKRKDSWTLSAPSPNQPSQPSKATGKPAVVLTQKRFKPLWNGWWIVCFIPDTWVALTFGLEMWMRNNWGLWHGSRLVQYLNSIGHYYFPDDASSFILKCFWDHLNGQPLELDLRWNGRAENAITFSSNCHNLLQNFVTKTKLLHKMPWRRLII